MKMESGILLYLTLVYLFHTVAMAKQERHRNDISYDGSSRPQFVGDLKNITVAIGREATFSCNVRNLVPFKVGWVRSDSKAILSLHNSVITYDSRITLSGDFASTFNLHIGNVQEEDRGQYMCQINTDPMMFQTATLDVNVPPDIDTEQTSGDVEAKLGSTVKLQCNADGYPKPTIKWRREDGNLIKINPKNGRGEKRTEKFIGPNLTISHVQEKDMGSYLCIADNGVPPIVSKRIFLYVQFAPTVSAQAVIGAVEDRPVVLSCEAKAYPKAMVEWMRYGSIVRSNGAWTVKEKELSIFGKKKTLRIHKADQTKNGTYVCRASNSIGSVERKVQLYLIKKPKNVAQTTQNLPETDPTIQIPYLEEVEITKEKFDSEQRRKNVELNGYLEQQSNSDFESTKYDMVNSGKSHRQNTNSFMTADGITNRSYNFIVYFSVLLCFLCLL